MTTSTIQVNTDSFTSTVDKLSTTEVAVHSQEYYSLQEARDFLGQYFIWIIFAFGFPGNLISLLVIICMSRHRLKTSLFYVALLAVVDNLAIVMKLFEHQTRHNGVHMAPVSCKFSYFFGLTGAAYANWILIIMSAERFTAVIFPLKVALIWSLKRALIIIVAVGIILSLLHMHIFFTMTSHTTNHTCIPDEEFETFYEPWWYVISASIYAIVPAITISILNIAIIRQLKKSSNQRRDLIVGNIQSDVTSRRLDRQMTIMLVTVAIVFIILTIPRCIITIIWNYWKPADPVGKMRKSLADVLSGNCADTTHAVNFYLYFVSGKKFRNYLIHRCKFKQQRTHEVNPELQLPLRKMKH